MNYFIDALTQNKEEEKLYILYQDTINLYSMKPDFEFLINLFIKSYNNKKNCQRFQISSSNLMILMIAKIQKMI